MVAVVTGGASGIGRALGEALANAGATVVLSDVEKDALDKTVEELSASTGATVTGVQADVSDFGSVDSLADQVFRQFGVCNILINNAGVGAPSAMVWESTPNDWKWVFGVNVFGVVHGVQAFVPRMIASGAPGYVVNTSSGDGAISPMPQAACYAASQSAVAITTARL